MGIVSILFCGIVMGHYTRRNLSAGGRALTMGAFGLMAQLSETFVFIYIGASVFLALPKYFSTAVWAVAMCFASRYVAVFPGVSLINAHTGTDWRRDARAREVGANAPTPRDRAPAVNKRARVFYAYRGRRPRWSTRSRPSSTAEARCPGTTRGCSGSAAYAAPWRSRWLWKPPRRGATTAAPSSPAYSARSSSPRSSWAG